MESNEGYLYGNMLLDDEYLRERHGFTDEDFVSYRYDPNFEPPRLLAGAANETSNDSTAGHVKRGEVGRLSRDIEKSSTLSPSSKL